MGSTGKEDGKKTCLSMRCIIQFFQKSKLPKKVKKMSFWSKLFQLGVGCISSK